MVVSKRAEDSRKDSSSDLCVTVVDLGDAMPWAVVHTATISATHHHIVTAN